MNNKKNFIDEMMYNPQERILNPMYDEYQSPVYNPNPKLYDEPIYNPNPINDGYQQPVYIPQFPNYSMMDCAQLQIEMNDLNQTLMTSRFVYELRVAYEQAYSAAQDQYILKCGRKETPLPPEGCTYDADFNLICIEPEPIDVFVDDTQSPIKTEVPDAQSNPTFIDDTKAAVPTLPTTVSKNLKPYIYVGLGIVAILVVARILTKK